MPNVFDKPPHLYDTQTTPDIFWSPSWTAPTGGSMGGCNSYVLLPLPQPHPWKFNFLSGGKPVRLVSINGRGEIRWDFWVSDVVCFQERLQQDPDLINRPWDAGSSLDAYLAFQHFGLQLPEIPE